MRDLSYKKYKHVVAVGCSYTNSSHENENTKRNNPLPLEQYINGQPPSTSFVNEFSKRVNAKSYNLAKAGLSFKFILYYAFLWIQNNLDKVEEALLIVGLTHRRRETFFNSKHEGGIELEGLKKAITSPYVIPVKPLTIDDFEKYKWLQEEVDRLGVTREAYSYFTDLLWNTFNDTEQRDAIDEMYMVMLQSYCNSIGLDILFIDIANEAKSPIKQNFRDWREIVEPIFKWPDGSDSWKHYLTKKDKNYRGEHPNYNDHVELGELLYEYINI